MGKQQKSKKRRHSSSSSSSSKSQKHIKKEEVPIVKELPSFQPSGILLKYAANAITEDKVLKFTQPMDAKIPTQPWKIFPFKNDQALETIILAQKSVFLLGKDHEIADIYLQNPTISAQHAVIQFREIRKVNNRSEVMTYIKPYLMDLESTNGSYLNGKKIEPARYYELIDQDVLKFGNSDREYVLIKP